MLSPGSSRDSSGSDGRSACRVANRGARVVPARVVPGRCQARAWHLPGTTLAPLRPDDGAIAPPRRPPRIVEVRRTRRIREFRGELLVDLDPQPWLLSREHVAVFHLGAPNEDVPRLQREAAALVDAEVVTRQLQGQLRGVRDRRRVARSVPRGANAEVLTQRGHLARRAQPTDLRQVNADEIDQAIPDERDVLVLRV